MKKNKSLNYVANFKYLMIVPIVILLASIVLGAIFGFNLDYDFRKVSNFSVKFNTTVTEVEYDILEDEIEVILDNNGFNDYRLERVGTGAQSAVFVRIPNDNNNLDSKITEVKTVIEDNLLTSVEGIESAVVITLSETDYSLPKNVTNLIWMSILTIVCVVVFVFFYTWIRYNLIAGCSLAVSLIIAVVMLLSSMIAFRVPFNYDFVVPFVIMIFSIIINSIYINNYLKSTLNNEAFAKHTNEQRVLDATERTSRAIMIYSALITIAILAVMFFGGYSLIYLGVAIILGIHTSIFVSLFVTTTLWSMWYKKDKDKMLLRRIEADKQKELNKGKKIKKEDEKILV